MGGAAPDTVTAEAVAAGAAPTQVDVAALQARIAALEAQQAASPAAPKAPGQDLADHLAAKVAAHPYHDLATLAEKTGQDLVEAIEAHVKAHPEVDLSYVLHLATEAAAVA
jgi:hypothetical protein